MKNWAGCKTHVYLERLRLFLWFSDHRSSVLASVAYQGYSYPEGVFEIAWMELRTISFCLDSGLSNVSELSDFNAKSSKS
jgi:hypothetical protein